MKWIAVDYGDARTGLAGVRRRGAGDGPITPQIEEKSMNRAAQAVAAVVCREKAGGVVLGLPKNMDGSEGARAARTRRFAQRLADACGLPVALWDERRTTVTAAAILAGTIPLAKSASSGWILSRPPCCWTPSWPGGAPTRARPRRRW